MLRVFLIATLLACNPKSKTDDVQIQKMIIKMGQSYKIDLEKETYTVYFMNGTSYDCKFTLNNQEKTDINEMAKECGFTKLQGNVRIEDECRMFPKVMTELSFYAGNNHVQVSIDAGCSKHPWIKDQEADGIVKFLKFLNEKVMVKPEVAKAPQTDIRYM